MIIFKAKNTSHYLLFIFLSLLIVSIFFKNNPWQKEAEALLLLPKLQVDRVEKIKLSAESNKIILEKSGNEWFLLDNEKEATKAAKEKVDAFLQTIAGFKKSDLVSQNKEKFVNFELSDELAKKISFWQGDELLLLVGKNSVDFMGSYVRVQNGDFVYKVNYPLSSIFTASAFK